MRHVTFGIVVAFCMVLTINTIGTALAQGTPTAPTRGIRRFAPAESEVDEAVSRLVVQAAPFAVTLLPGSALSRLLADQLSASPSEIAQVETAREKPALNPLCIPCVNFRPAK